MKIGDRVELKPPREDMLIASGRIKAGDRGTIVADSDGSFGVDWDNFTTGHRCGGASRTGHGWSVSEHFLKKIKPNIWRG